MLLGTDAEWDLKEVLEKMLQVASDELPLIIQDRHLFLESCVGV